jgi:Ankyrin repeats (3 copies)
MISVPNSCHFFCTKYMTLTLTYTGTYTRVPLVISAIINVAQQVKEDWILELIGHDGVAVNITLRPGEMILYEGHSIIHGRPYPLNGHYNADCLFHFEPIGYSNKHFDMDHTVRHQNVATKTTEEKFQEAFAKLSLERKSLSTESISSPPDTVPKSQMKLPHYIIEGTIEAQRWRQQFEFRRVILRIEEEIDEKVFPLVMHKATSKTLGATSAHVLAAKNDIARLREVAKTDPKSLDTPDSNGWLPLHEAARGGSTEVVKFLVEEVGIRDINARTNDGKGGNALWWAEYGLSADHEVVKVLKRNGAVAMAPLPKKKKTNTEGSAKDDEAVSADEEEVAANLDTVREEPAATLDTEEVKISDVEGEVESVDPQVEVESGDAEEEVESVDAEEVESVDAEEEVESIDTESVYADENLE